MISIKRKQLVAGVRKTGEANDWLENSDLLLTPNELIAEYESWLIMAEEGYHDEAKDDWSFDYFCETIKGIPNE